MEGVGPQAIEALLGNLQNNALLGISDASSQNVDTQDGVLVKDIRAWFAAVLFLEAPASEVERDACIEDVGEEGAKGDEEGRVRHMVRRVRQGG